jgi:hypothetical protein
VSFKSAPVHSAEKLPRTTGPMSAIARRTSATPWKRLSAMQAASIRQAGEAAALLTGMPRRSSSRTSSTRSTRNPAVAPGDGAARGTWTSRVIAGPVTEGVQSSPSTARPTETGPAGTPEAP